MSTRSELIAQLDGLRHNPALVQRLMIDQVEKTYNGTLELVDPMNPVVFLLEASATLGADGVIHGEALSRRQYPSVALTMEDLYLHMSDKDYLDRFSTPSEATITVLLGKDEVYEKAVATGSGGVRKLTIPRHTAFTVGGVTFSMQYPIDIRIMGHGGLQIVYNNDQPSPLYTLDSNRADWSIMNYNAARLEFIVINIPVKQFKVTSVVASLNGVTGFRKTYPFEDKYYYCRVYMSKADGSWQEIITTHSDQVFDPMKPTVVLKVVDQELTVYLPQVYFTTGLVNTELRIDIYTTKGPLEMPLTSYTTSDFVAAFIDREKEDGGKFYAPLTNFSSIAVYGNGAATGGSDGLSFEELRNRLINNASGNNDIPVTEAQLTGKLQDVGFASVKYIDNVTDLVYLATRMLPKPSAGATGSGAGAAMAQLTSSLDDLIKAKTIVDNGTRITILPSTLFQNDNGRLKVVDELGLATLKAMTGEKLADAVTAGRYLFTPFHYVLDITGNTFDTRPYYFGNPVISNKHFVDENDTIGVGVSTNDHHFERTESGWRLLVKTNSGDSFKALDDVNIYVQLRFKPVGEVDYAYVNGTLLSKDSNGERLYEFLLDTNWDLDSDSNLSITNFTMYDTNPRTVKVNLSTTFDLTFVIANYSGGNVKFSQLDQLLGTWLLPPLNIALYEEQLTLKLGDNLDGLWTKSRTIIGPYDYQRYTQDVYQTYPENVYQRDITGAAVITIVDGKPQFTQLHAAGDIVLDAYNQPIILHHKDDPVLDSNKQPILKAPRNVLRMTDLFVMDGVYYYATTATDTGYRESIPGTVVNWLNDAINPLEKKLLERTQLYYYPKATIGLVDVYINNEESTQLYAEQDLTVTFYVTQQVYRNVQLRDIMKSRTIEVISALLEKSNVSTTEILATLKAVLGDDIITVEIEGIGGRKENIPTITIKDDSSRLCIGKRLVATPDGNYEVQDAVTVAFVKHLSL